MRWWWLIFISIAAVQAAPVSLPLDTLSVTNQRLVRAVLTHCTLHQQPATRKIAGRLADFVFLLDNAGACAALADQCELVSYRPVITPEGRLIATNQEGTVGWLELVDCRPDRRIYYVEGAQSGSFTARGQAVVVVNFRQTGPTEIEYSGELFVRLDNAFAAVLMRLFMAFVRRAVDQSFGEVMALPAGLTQLALDQPALIRALIQAVPVADYIRLQPWEQRLGESAQ